MCIGCVEGMRGGGGGGGGFFLDAARIDCERAEAEGGVVENAVAEKGV